jgi:nucleotide-binding universal stress UspA family protein
MLFEIKNILVCTDLSEKSDEVLRGAHIVQKRTHSEIHILFVSNAGIRYDFEDTSDLNETFYENFNLGFQKDLLHKLREQIIRTGIRGRLIIAEGDVIKEITSRVLDQNIKYDLLILGHTLHDSYHNPPTLLRYFGSICRKILSSVEIPTIIVKEKIAFNTLGAFVDGSRPLDWMVAMSFDFYRILQFSKIEFISLRMIGVSQNELIDFKEQLSEDISYLSRKGDTYEVKIESTHEIMLAHHFARIIAADKVDLAILKRNRGKKINKKFIGSETLRLLELDTCSLLILPVS